MDKQPTEAQIKEFWKKCGLNIQLVSYGFWITFSDGRESEFVTEHPTIDLNSLFKYAVPKLNKSNYAVCLDQVPGSLDWYCQIVLSNCSVAVTYRLCPKEPILTLFWAIWEVIHNDTR